MEDSAGNVARGAGESRLETPPLEGPLASSIFPSPFQAPGESSTRLLFEHLPIGLVLHRFDGRIVDANPAFARIVGRTLGELLELSMRDLTPRGSADEDARLLEDLEQIGRFSPIEKELLHQSGQVVPVRTSGLLIEQGAERFIWSSVEDITEHVLARRSRAGYAQFLEVLERIHGVIRRDIELDAMLRDVLQTLLGIFRCERAYLVHPCSEEDPHWNIAVECSTIRWAGTGATDAGRADSEGAGQVDELSSAMRRALRSERPVRYGSDGPLPLPAALEAGAGQHAEIHLALRPSSGPPWLLGLSQGRGRADWSAAEAQLMIEIGHRLEDGLTNLLVLRDLRDSERRYRELVENAPEAIFVIDLDAQAIVEANPVAVRLLGYTKEELFALDLADISPRLQADGTHSKVRGIELLRRTDTGEPQTFEWLLQSAQGKLIPCEVRLLRLPGNDRRSIRGTVTDITERQGLEDELRQSQKMEAVGKLAGGVAHDFNNILVAILGHSALLADSLEEDSRDHQNAVEIHLAGERAAELTRQLLAFSRKQVLAPVALDLNQSVTGMARLLQRVIGEHVELRSSLATEPIVARADPGQVEQVLLNLVTNARDAMPDGGALIIATGYRELDSSEAAHASLAPGRYATLTVTDEGQGMSAAVREHIFEPFFTTKELGKGTGLGLSTVYGIVTQSGGGVLVRSELEVGSSFEVLLPVASLTAGEEREEAQFTHGGHETILVVEDEPAVASLVDAVLRGKGYEVLVASDGEEALELIWGEDAPHIDLLFTDVIMPRMGGIELAQELRRRLPHIKVLYTTGYTEESLPIDSPGAAVLEKPYAPNVLADSVRGVLDR